jgi:hypothetical protein
MGVLPGADQRETMSTRPRHSRHDELRQIACLACGETRVVFGVETGECPRCHYLGWTYSDELDGSTRRMILNRAFARRSFLAPLAGPAATRAVRR